MECLSGLSDQQSAEKVASFFSQVSNEYEPLDMSKLPAYLPAQQQLKVYKNDVAHRIFSLKNRKSTHIFNSSLKKYHYPKLWKHEWVVPAQKVNNPKVLKDLRKISLTSEFSLIYEGIMKDWIMRDIGPLLMRPNMVTKVRRALSIC